MACCGPNLQTSRVLFSFLKQRNYFFGTWSATEMKCSYSLLLAQFLVSNVLKIMVNFISVKSWGKVLFLAAEIDFLEQNCVWALELSWRTLWRHWLYSRKKRYRFSLVFTWFIQVYSSYCWYLLVFYLVISVQSWQEIHIMNVGGHQRV